MSCVAAKTSAEVGETSQERAFREQVQKRQQVDQARQSIQQVMRNGQHSKPNNYSEQLVSMLAAAGLKYDQAKRNKEKNRPDYVIALSELANAYFANKEFERAASYMEEAYTEYHKLPGDQENARCTQAIWQHLGMLPASDFQTCFEQLFQKIEAETPSTIESGIISGLASLPNQQKEMTIDGHFDAKSFYKSAIDIRSKARGSNDSSLYWLLEQYGEECQNQHDLSEAERAFVWKTKLHSSAKDLEQTNAAKVRLARFYAEHSMFDKSAPMLPELLTFIKPGVPYQVVSELVWLSNDYAKSSHLPESDEIVSAILKVGGDSNVSAVNSVVDALVTSYTDSLSFDKARNMLEKRVKASETCQNDYAAGLVRLHLSNIDLALGNVAESNELYEGVKKLYALRGQDVERMEAERTKLIRALKKE